MRPSESPRVRAAGFAALCVGVLTHSPAFAAFNANDFYTYSEVEWGEDPTPTNIAGVLESDFNSVFAPENDLMVVGLPQPAGHSMIFDSADAIINYLPAGGTPGPLVADLLDPIDTSSGFLGSSVVALTLNVDFSDAGIDDGNLNIPFGNLILTGLSGDLAFANGMNVRSVLGEADTALGGGPLPASDLSYDDFTALIDDLNLSFNTGPVSSFAQSHLELPATTVTVPEPGSLGTAAAGVLLLGIAAALRGRRTLKPR